MMMEKRFTCVVCPIGCELKIEYDEKTMNEESFKVTGNTCPRGAQYAKTEIVSPERTLTSTVRSDSTVIPMIPVKTSAPIPKGKLFEAMKQLNTINVNVPVNAGDILVKNFIKEGVDLVIARSVKE